MNWARKKPKLKSAVLIEGLPGIGNAGKVAIDFLMDNFKAKRLCDFRSALLPHSVFVNEKGLVELPNIALYLVERKKGPSLLLLAGDVQPVNEESCYDFCHTLLELAKDLNVKEVIATGGIGLRQVPKKPRIYVTGTTKQALKPYAKMKVRTDLYGTVGPIIGVSGVLVGLAGREQIPAVALLAEVYGHPMYLGVRGAKELLRVINAHLGLKINFKAIEKEIEELENELTEKTQDRPLQLGFGKYVKDEDINYIG